MPASRRSSRRLIHLGPGPAAVSVLLAIAASPALAQDALRPALEGRDFNIDLVTGPVLGAGRAVGLGGAFTALATGADGGSWNASAWAARGLWDLDWFEWEITLNLVPGAIRNSDFDNNGERGFTYDTFLFGTIGLGLQFGELGLGGLANVQSYAVGNGTDVVLAIYNYAVAYAFARGQLIAGIGLRTASLTIGPPGGGDALVDVAGTSPEAGVSLRPAGQPWRLGAAARLPVTTAQPEALVAAGFTLPRSIRLPWEVQLGAAVQLGPRPLNRRWTNPHDVEDELRAQMLERQRTREREQYEREAIEARIQMATERTPPRVGELEAALDAAPLPEGMPRDRWFWREEKARRAREEYELQVELQRREHERQREYDELSRRYLLISVDTVLVGPTERGVGVESFLSQREHVSGRRVTVGFRAGIEGEPIAHWLKMRAGTYFEPSRFERVPYRVHATAGTDLRLFSWDLFGLIEEFTLRAGASADVAERYLNVGVGIGLWH